MRQLGNSVRIAATILLSLGIAACDDGAVTVSNQNPTGTIGGLVLDAATQMPLEGVAVHVLSAGGTFDSTTATDGFYRIADVPAGAFVVQVSKMGFAPLRVEGYLDGAVGNFPVAAPLATLTTVGLVPVGADFTLRVVSNSGAPLAGVKASARSPLGGVTYSGSSPSVSAGLVVSAESAADGRITFAGLPTLAAVSALNGSVTIYDPTLGTYLGSDAVVITVAPMRIDGQDNYDYAGGVVRYSLLASTTTLPQLVLSGPTSAFQIVESNLEWLRSDFTNPTVAAPVAGSMVAANGPITIAFSEAVNASTLRVQVTTESGAPGPTLTPTVNLNLVSLVPSAPFTAGARYNLNLHADPMLNPGTGQRQRNVIAPFFVRTDPATKPTVVTAKLTGNVVQFVLSEPVGLGDGAVQSYNCVNFYEGVNLDGSGAGLPHVSGEWNSDPGALTCSIVSPVTPALNAVAVNAGLLGGTENKGAPAGMPITGFTTVFEAAFQQYTGPPPAVTPAAGSSIPTIGTKGHLYFPRLAGTVRRATGEPVGDLTFTLQ